MWDLSLQLKDRSKALFRPLVVLILLCDLSLSCARSDVRESHQPRMHSEFKFRGGQSSRATAKEIEKLLSNIEVELRPWAKSGITREMVERAYCLSRWTASTRVQIKNNRLYATPPDHVFQSRERTILLQLVHLLQKYDLPDIDVMLVTDDFCPDKDIPHRSFDGNYKRCSRLGPTFSISKLPEERESHCVNMPDFSFQGWPEQFLPPWQLTRSLLQNAADNQPWRKRSDVLFWKGGNTHPERDILVNSNMLQQSGMAQVHFVNFSNAATYVSLPEHCHHKYLLNMEGYSYSSRLKYIMACGSAIIYPNKRYTEFWYHMLDETNHIPVERTSPENRGAPILSALKKLKADESRAERIGKAAQHLVLEVLHPDNVDRYFAELIIQYSKLMTFDVELHPDVLPVDVILLRPLTLLDTDNRTCTHC